MGCPSKNEQLQVGRGPCFFAHSTAGKSIFAWKRLEEHLVNVANMASRFSEELGAAEWGYLAGLSNNLEAIEYKMYTTAGHINCLTELIGSR
jgi:hypothetical protein